MTDSFVLEGHIQAKVIEANLDILTCTVSSLEEDITICVVPLIETSLTRIEPRV